MSEKTDSSTVTVPGKNCLNGMNELDIIEFEKIIKKSICPK